MNDEEYVSIRELLGAFIGKTVVDITQHDEEEYEETGEAFIMIGFTDGSYLKFFLDEDADIEVFEA